MSAAIAGLGALMTAALAAPAAAYLLIRPRSQKQSDFVPATDLAQLTPGKPEEVVNTALFVASSEASFITGSDIVVDGGLLAV